MNHFIEEKQPQVVGRDDKEPGRAEQPYGSPLIVDTLDLPDRNLRPGVQWSRAQSSGRGNRSRWRSGKAVSRSVKRVGYQWKFSASYVRVSTKVNSPSKIESGHGPVSIAIITVRWQRIRSNSERHRNGEVNV